MISVKQIESNFKSIFDNTRLQIFESVYEESKDEDYFKLVYSIHGLDVSQEDGGNTTILHTKFIFRVNKSKTTLYEDSFWYLKDINCKYVKIDFDTNSDLVDKLGEIINENSFGDDMMSLSNFISEAPSSSINDFLHQNFNDEFSVTSVIYNPVVKISPCKETTFDFEIDINNGENQIKLSIHKNDDSKYDFTYYVNTDIEAIESEYLEPLPQLIGDHLQYLYKKFIK